MLKIAYITLYLMQSVNSLISGSEETLPEHTLFQKHGPVFMRRTFFYDVNSRSRTRTEPTVLFQGTLSMPVWKIIDVTLPPTTSSTEGFDPSMLNALVYSNRDAALTDPFFRVSSQPPVLRMNQAPLTTSPEPEPEPNMNNVRPPFNYPNMNPNEELPSNPNDLKFSNHSDAIDPNIPTSPSPNDLSSIYAAIMEEQRSLMSQMRPPISNPVENSTDSNVETTPIPNAASVEQNTPSSLESSSDSSTPNHLILSKETNEPEISQEITETSTRSTASASSDTKSIEDIRSTSLLTKISQKMTKTSTSSTRTTSGTLYYPSSDTTPIDDIRPTLSTKVSQKMRETSNSPTTTTSETSYVPSAKTIPIVDIRTTLSTKMTETSTSLTTTSGISYHPSYDTPIEYIRTPALLRMPSPNTAAQTWRETFAPEQLTEHTFTYTFEAKQQNTQVASTQKSDLGSMETEPFSMFLRRLLSLLLTKDIPELATLIKAFEIYLTILVDGGKLMKLGSSTCLYIVQQVTQLRAPIIELQKQLFMGKINVESRRQRLSDEVNAILDDMDDMYDESEEEAMQRVLKEIRAYPFAGKSGDILVSDFVNAVFVYPMHRVAGTPRGNKLFGRISILASKNNVNNVRRVMSNDKKFRKPFRRRNDRQYRGDNILIDTHTNDGLGMRDREKLKTTRKSLYYVPVDKEYKELSKSFKIYNNEKFKGRQLIYSSSASEEAVSSSEDKGVEIRIKIKNGKYSKINEKRHLASIYS